MASAKRKLYLDTSILGFALQKQHPQYRREANILLRQIREGSFVGGYSFLLEKEIAAAPYRVSKKLKQKIEWSRLRRIRVRSRSMAYALAERYCDAHIFPIEFFEDALHVAIASFWRAEAVVSYNFAHIVRLDTMAGVRAINEMENLPTIFLCQPAEVILR